MERFPWHPRLRHTVIARPLVLAGITLTLAVVAAVGMAATLAAPGPNGCPTDKSTKPNMRTRLLRPRQHGQQSGATRP